MRSTCAHTSTRSASSVSRPAAEQVRERVRDRRPPRRPLVQVERDPRRVPEEERRHDAGDQRQDQVGLADVAALEPGRPLHLADDERRHDAGEDQHREDVDEQREPPLAGRATGSSGRLSTTAIIAITIVGKSTRKPQKMKACISPGTSRWSSLRWPSAITTSLRTRAGSSPDRSLGRPILTSRTSTTRPPGEQPAADRQRPPSSDEEGDRVYPPLAFRISATIGRHHLVQVADHGVVGVRDDRRVGIGVDREDPLGALAAGHVLGRAADAAGDVDLGRDLGAGLADLIGVRPPAGDRDRARAADRSAEQLRELLDRREPLGRAGPAAAAHDDLRVGQRHAAARVRLGTFDDARDEVGLGQLGRERLDLGRRRRRGGPRLDGVRSDGEQLRRTRAPGPPRAGSRPSGRG